MNDSEKDQNKQKRRDLQRRIVAARASGPREQVVEKSPPSPPTPRKPRPLLLVRAINLEVVLFEDRLIIRNNSNLPTILQGPKFEREIYLNGIQGIAVMKPGFQKGLIRFNVSGGDVVIPFYQDSYENMLTLRDLIQERKRTGPPVVTTSQSAATPVSVADELAKLVKLRKSGHITEEEFRTLRKRVIDGL